MTDTNKWIARLSATALGALLIGLPAGAARAAEPTTAADARMCAAQSADRAAHLSALGGQTYKAGLVQSAQADAARYNAIADRLTYPPVMVQQTPESAHYAALAAHYRFIGGPWYKMGMVQWAERQQHLNETVIAPYTAVAPEPAAGAPLEPNPVCMADKPVAQISCLNAGS